MLHLFLIYLNIASIFLTKQEESNEHYSLGESHIDFFNEFDFDICAFDHTYSFHKPLKNQEVCILTDNFLSFLLKMGVTFAFFNSEENVD